MTDQERKESADRVLRLMSTAFRAMAVCSAMAREDGKADDWKNTAMNAALMQLLVSIGTIYPDANLMELDIKRAGEAFGMVVFTVGPAPIPAGGTVH